MYKLRFFCHLNFLQLLLIKIELLFNDNLVLIFSVGSIILINSKFRRINNSSFKIEFSLSGS